MTAKPISIKGAGCKSGGYVRKAVELTSGDLLFVRNTGLREGRPSLTGQQKSAAGIVAGNGEGPNGPPVRRVKREVSKRRDS
jgi:hypothetical protein